MWFAQETSSPSPIELIQYGALGLVVVALILGWLWAKPAVDRLLHDKDRIIAERNAERDGQLERLTTEIRELRGEVGRLTERVGRDRDVGEPP